MGTQVYASTGQQQAVSGWLYTWNCAECGILMGVPADWLEERRKDAGTIYCPNGHTMSYRKTEADREREKRRKAEEQRDRARNRADQAELAAAYQRRRVASLRGHLTRMRNRIAAGVCPVPGCQRTGLTQTTRHILAKHPDWAHQHPDALQ